MPMRRMQLSAWRLRPVEKFVGLAAIFICLVGNTLSAEGNEGIQLKRLNGPEIENIFSDVFVFPFGEEGDDKKEYFQSDGRYKRGISRGSINSTYFIYKNMICILSQSRKVFCREVYRTESGDYFMVYEDDVARTPIKYEIKSITKSRKQEK